MTMTQAPPATIGLDAVEPEKPPATFMAYDDREKSIRMAELRQREVPLRQRLEAATEAAIAQTETFLGHLGDPVVSAETIGAAARATMARLDERRAAKAAHDEISKELGW